MKVIKPHRLGFLSRAVTSDGRRYHLAVTGLVSVPLAAPRDVRMEIALWKDVSDHVPGGVLDEAYPKPRAEVLVHGAAHASGGEPAGAVMARVVVRRGEATLVDKRVAVFGERIWAGSTPSDPVPFESMPMDWGHAFGGEGYDENPGGKGFVDVEGHEGKPVRPLPNVEDPEALIVDKDDRPIPAGFGVIDLSWPRRMALAGKDYGEEWLATRFPGPALDFDPRFYNVAAADQQFDGKWDGTETIRVEGMHPGGPVEGTLTPLALKAMVTQRIDPDPEGSDDTRFTAHELELETVHVLPEAERAILIYRTTIPVGDDEADDIEHLLLAAEDPAQPKSLEHYAAVLEGRLDKERGALLSMKDEDLMPPPGEGWSCKPDYGDMVEKTALDHRALKRGEKARKAKLDAAKAELTAAGFDVEKAFEEPDIPAIPDPYDVDAILDTVEKMEAKQAEMQAEAKAEKARMEKEAREAFEEAGFDYDAEMKKAAEASGGPPTFSADEQLIMLHDMARIASAGGVPMEDLERDLLNPAYEQMLRDLETRAHDGYRQFAHMMPAAALPDDARRAQLRVIVEASRESDTSLVGKNLIGADLSGLDLSGVDLSGALLEGADLSGANLHGANLSRSVLSRANLENADLSGADLTGANLGDCALVGTDLSDATLSDTVLMKARLERTRLHGARFEGTDFLEVTFQDVDFSHAHCKQALFLQADLRGIVFAGASLIEARFLQVDLRGVDFTGAMLDRAQFIQANGDGAVFSGASLVGASFVHESSFVDCVFTGADLQKVNFHRCPLERSEFTRAKLSEANLIKADLRGADMRQIVARKALMMRARLRDADLRGADLLEAIAQKADLRGADLRGANLSRGDVSLARFDQGTKVDDVLLIDTRVDPRRQKPEEGRAL